MGVTQLESVESTVVTLAGEHRETALDLGCGTGRNTLYLAQHGYRVTAVDTDADALEALMRTARQRNLQPRVKIREADMLECVSGEWDAIIVCLVLHRYARDDAKTLLTRVQMCTKPFGLNAIIGWMDEGAVAAEIKRERPDAFFLTKDFLHERYQRWHRVTQGNRAQSGGRLLTGLYRK